MPKDYAHRSLNKNKKGTKKFIVSIKFLLLTILLLVMCSCAFYLYKKAHLHHLQTATATDDTSGGAVVTEAKPIQLATDNNTSANQQTTTVATDDQATPKKDVKFDFYQMLPKMRVTIDSNQTTNTPTTHNEYILQLASFTDPSEATNFQTRIKHFGFNTNLHKTEHNNTTRYRVQIGPFKQIQAAEDMRDSLQTHNIDCILIRINHD